MSSVQHHYCSNRINRRTARWELWAAGLFVAVHLASPLLIGELYPFTISPMFCDCPQQCCQYEVFAADGSPLEARRFNLHMVYDGNPPGLGMGIVPHPTMHPFGEIPSKQRLVEHVRQVLENTQGDFGGRVVVHQHCFIPDKNRIKREERTFVVDAIGKAQ